MLIQNFQNYGSVFLKDTFSITFQQFRKRLFKIHFSFSGFLKSVYLRDNFNLNSNFLKMYL